MHYRGNDAGAFVCVDIRRNLVYDWFITKELPIYFRMNGPKVSTVTPAKVTTIGNDQGLLDELRGKCFYGHFTVDSSFLFLNEEDFPWS